MNKMLKVNDDKVKALEYLHEYLKPGDTVYTILRHVSQSGMVRDISALVHTGRVMYEISHLVARVLDMKVNRDHGGIRIGGCGTDEGFQIVYNLGYVMFPDGHGCIGEGCRSNEHSNGDRDWTPHSEEHQHWHKTRGYVFNHRWL